MNSCVSGFVAFRHCKITTFLARCTEKKNPIHLMVYEVHAVSQNGTRPKCTRYMATLTAYVAAGRTPSAAQSHAAVPLPWANTSGILRQTADRCR